MKVKSLPFLFLYLILLFCNAQNSFAYEFTIMGQVTEGDSNTPAPQMSVTYYAENANFLNQQYTDENGIYSMTFEIPDGTAINFIGEVLDVCTGDVITATVTSIAGTSTVNYIICFNNPPNDCEAMFDYHYAPTNSISVIFNDISITPEPTETWFWDFGDGETSDEPNPHHFYNEPGQYLVTLTIHSPNCTSTVSQYIWVDGNDNGNDCISWFYYTQNNSNNFLEVSFFSIVQADNVAAYAWDFGDNTASDMASPVHTYAAEGTYTVSLTVTTIDGCTSTFLQDITLQAPPECEAYFYYVQEDPNNLLNIHFFDYSFGDIESWSWDFGDGTTNDEQNPVHIYADAGEFEVSLNVTTVTGCTSTYSETVFIWLPPECEAHFTYQANYPDNFLEISFQDNSQGAVDSWFWDFGMNETSTEQHPVHTFPEEGTYPVSLTITAGDCSSTITFFIEVYDVCICTQDYDPVCVATPNGGVITYPNPCFAMCDGFTSDDFVDCGNNVPCQAHFNFNPDADDELTIHFTDDSYGDVVNWSWEFGDGTGSNEQNPSHTFAAEGHYPVSLTITTADNCTDVISIEIPVGGVWNYPEDCQAMFWFALDENNPLTVHFEDLSIGEDISAWTWDFGDGSSSTEQNPVHTYAMEGIYLVNLTIVSGNCTSTIDMLVWASEEVIYNEDCQALFLPAINGLEVSFFDLSIGDVVDWQWDFGDGNGSTEPLPVHTYAATGAYMVTLTITTADGCSSIIETTINLNNENFQPNGASSAQLSALGIDWLFFELQEVEKTVVLQWQTSHEQTANYFMIEKSIDGRTFETIGQVAAKKTTINSYEFIDSSPLEGRNYYRLQEVETSGKRAFSTIEVIDFSTKNDLLIYPNPVSGDVVNLSFKKALEQETLIEVWNNMGQLVLQREWQVIEKDDTLDMTALGKGVYLIKVNGQILRLVKL